MVFGFSSFPVFCNGGFYNHPVAQCRYSGFLVELILNWYHFCWRSKVRMASRGLHPTSSLLPFGNWPCGMLPRTLGTRGDKWSWWCLDVWWQRNFCLPCVKQFKRVGTILSSFSSGVFIFFLRWFFLWFLCLKLGCLIFLFKILFWDRVWLSCSGWPWTCNPPASIFWVAGIADLSPLCQTCYFYFASICLPCWALVKNKLTTFGLKKKKSIRVSSFRTDMYNHQYSL